MFSKPNIHLVPTRRRTDARIKLNSTTLDSIDKNNKFPEIQEKRREDLVLAIRDNLNVSDINGQKSKKYYQSKIKDIMNLYRIKGAEPKLTKPKNIDENNSFDYSDVNISRRVIRKMIHSSLFDHKPFEKAKYLEKMSVGNKFISKVDPIDSPNPNPIYHQFKNSTMSLGGIEKSYPLHHSIDLKDFSSLNKNSNLNKTVEYDGDRYLGRSASKMQSYFSSKSSLKNSFSPSGTKSLKEFISQPTFAGKPTNHHAFDFNKGVVASSSQNRNDRLELRSMHYKSNQTVVDNPYSNKS